jgi:hypothetical protein
MATFEELDENEEGEEAGEEGEEEESLPAATPTGTGAMPAMFPQPQKQRKHNPNSSHKGKKVAARGRVPVTADRPSQADLLWVDVLARDEIVSRGLMAEHFSIRVSRLDAGAPIYLGSLDGARCVGDGEGTNAADALVRVLTDEIHWHSSRGMPATYELAFAWKRGGGIYDKGKIRLASTQEIAQMRNVEAGLGRPPQQGYAPPQYPPQQYGAPQPPYQPPPLYPQHPSAPQGYAPQGHGPSDEVTELREQVRSLTDLVRDMYRQQGLGQPPPNLAPQAPPQLPLSALGELTRTLAPFGLSIGPTHPQQPQMQQAPPTTQGVVASLGNLRELVTAVKELRGVSKSIEEAFAPDHPQQVQQPAEEPKPEPDFEMVEVPGSKWPNGDPVRYARDDGGINAFGTMFGNAWAMEKFGSTLAGLGKQIVKKIGPAGLGQAIEDAEETEEEEEFIDEPAEEQRQLTRANGAIRDDGFSL